MPRSAKSRAGSASSTSGLVPAGDRACHRVRADRRPDHLRRNLRTPATHPPGRGGAVAHPGVRSSPARLGLGEEDLPRLRALGWMDGEDLRTQAVDLLRIIRSGADPLDPETDRALAEVRAFLSSLNQGGAFSTGEQRSWYATPATRMDHGSPRKFDTESSPGAAVEMPARPDWKMPLDRSRPK